MTLKDLPDAAQQLVLQCLKAVAEGDAIEDWEFHARLGITRSAVKRFISQWPVMNDGAQGSDEFLALNNCMNEVCRGIRMTPEEWMQRFTEPRDRILQTYENWILLAGQTRGGIP
jgi:hypothetical protein